MDPITSAELDSPSKTPLFLGIAAIVLAIAGLVIALIGFTKVNELESQLAVVSTAAATVEAAEKNIAANTNKLDQVVAGVTTLREEVNTVLVNVQDDIKEVKKNIRSNAMTAGTAMKKVEELEATGVKVAEAPKPAPVIRTSKADGPVTVDTPPAAKLPAGQQEYTIKSGDFFSKLATKFNVTAAAIQAANPGVDPNRLQIGQKIVIPVAK